MVRRAMRGLTRRWLFRRPDQQDADQRLSLFDRVLGVRGLADPDTRRRFCEPRLTDLHDPALLPNLDAAVERIGRAADCGEPIVIYGDYDVDGIAATAILYHVIKAVAPQADVRTYVPHRLEEGYGLNAEALQQLRADGAGLVISVDCGITAHEAAAAARQLGLDLIITDHHSSSDAQGTLPEAVAVVHPRLAGSKYPFGDLCGAGVAFKVAWGLATHRCGSKRVPKAVQQRLLDMLPLAALATIADVVPLVGENRTIASWGLRWIKQTPIVGLRALIEASDLMKEDIDTEKVGFVLAPRLNACGRLGHAAEAIELLTTADPAQADVIAGRLAELNRQRQQTERRIAEQAARMAEDAGMTGDDRRIIVLADDSWHAGVVGVACSRLVDRFARPVVLLQRNGEVCRGSARSVDGFSIHQALQATAEHLIGFGGHDAAAGLRLETASLPAFTEALTEHANARIDADALVPSVWIDCDARVDELQMETVTRIKSLSPFGRENPRPTLRITGATIAGPPKQMGANGRHLMLSLRADGAQRRWLRLVWFSAGGQAADLAAGMRIDAVIEPKINAWNGRTSVEGMVRDVRVL